MEANYAATKRLKEKESELLPELQNPEKAAAERFIKEFLIPYFRIPEAIIDGKEYHKGILIYEWDCPERFPDYPYDVVRKAVEVSKEYGISAEERGQGNNRRCYFSKQY